MLNFSVIDSDSSIFKFFPARQVPEIILNEYEILKMRPQAILRNQSTCDFFGFKSSFQTFFWNFFITSGLSQICKKRNVWKLPSPFSMNTLI
jgi:hypothetical protein